MGVRSFARRKIKISQENYRANFGAEIQFYVELVGRNSEWFSAGAIKTLIEYIALRSQLAD